MKKLSDKHRLILRWLYDGEHIYVETMFRQETSEDPYMKYYRFVGYDQHGGEVVTVLSRRVMNDLFAAKLIVRELFDRGMVSTRYVIKLNPEPS